MEDDDAPGVPEWVVTYGDMMSLLLTFFIMLVSLSEIIENDKYRAILDALQRYTGYKTTPTSPPGDHFPLNSVIEKLKTLGSFAQQTRGTAGIRTDAVEGESVHVYRTRDGSARLVGEPLRFAPLSADLTDESKHRLVEISHALSGKPNKVEIRGHASPRSEHPNRTPADQMVLCYRRARAALEFLLSRGVDRDRLRIVTYGDLQPANITGDEKAVQHDRVEVFIIDAYAEEYVGPPSAND